MQRQFEFLSELADLRDRIHDTMWVLIESKEVTNTQSTRV